MSAKEQTKRSTPQQKPKPKPGLATLPTAGAARLPEGLTQFGLLDGLASQGTAVRLRQASALQMQRHQGNTAVQQMLARSHSIPTKSPKTDSPAAKKKGKHHIAAPVQRQENIQAMAQSPQPNQITANPQAQQGGQVQRGLWGWAKRGLKKLGKAAGGLLAKGAKWAFEKALGVAGVSKKAVMGLINRAGSAVMKIIKNPGRFINTIIKAIGQGFGQFKENISKHLKAGLMGWLFGTMGKAGIRLPKDFSIKSILSLILQVLGLTAEAIKAKIAKHIGAKNVKRLEKVWQYISTFMSEGLGGLWELLKNDLSNLKEMILGEIKSWLITQIIQAAVVKIIGMFNPVSGLITIIKTIYNVVKFLIQRAGQIKALFQAIAGSVIELAGGNVKKAANKIEGALARLIPVAIGFFASLMGISGIANRIKAIIQKIRTPIDKALDKLIMKLRKFGKRLLGGKKGKGGAAQSGSAGNQSARAKARQQVGKATQRPFKNERDLRSTVKSIEARLIPEGLKSLDITPKTGKAGRYDIIAREDVGDAQVGDTTFPTRRFLPPGFDVRRHLYINGSGFGSMKKKVKAEELEKLRDDIRKIRAPETSEAEKQRIWRRLVKAGKVPEDADRDKYTVAKVNAAKYDIDHFTSLARHWNEKGYNASDKSRQSIAGSRENLWLVLSSVNRSWGGEGYRYVDKPYVGKNFSSNYNKSPKNAFKIKGKRFRDETGKTLK